MNIQFFNCQTQPDIAGARALYKLSDEIADKDVAKIIFHHHLQDEGRDALYLKPFHAMINTAAVLEIRDFVPRVTMHSTQDRSEMELLAWLLPQLSGQPTRYWDGGRNLPALLKTRALVHLESFPQPELAAIEPTLSLKPGEIRLDQLANRLGIPVEIDPGDEANWGEQRKHEMAPLTRRCVTNLVGSTLIGLREMLLADEIDEEAFHELTAGCLALVKQGS